MTELIEAARVRRWLYDAALPLWSTAGIDPSGAGAWEALDHRGQPLAARNKRLRVMPRQAYVFASAGGAYVALARQLFDFAMTRGFDPNTQYLAHLLAPDGTILDAPHDLYDLAFMFLAASALTEAGEDVSADLAVLVDKLALLKAPRGWQERAGGKLPRRQNPHMHLFEAMTELYRVTQDAAYRAIADDCLGLFKEVFLQADGRVFEFFDAEWAPWPEQAVEPGHMAEWIWLLHRYETATGDSHGVDLEALWAAALRGRDGALFLRDVSEPLAETRRLWPQTEHLKASLVIGGQGELKPDQILERLFESYLATDVPGGWYDKRSCPDGALLSEDMPASSFYHLFSAMSAYLAAAEAQTVSAARTRRKQRNLKATIRRDAPPRVFSRQEAWKFLMSLGVRMDRRLGFVRADIEGPLSFSGAWLKGKIKIGAYAMVTEECYIVNTEVGRYSSVASRAACGLAEHPIDRLSSHSLSFAARGGFWNDAYFSEIRQRTDFPAHDRTVIGHDVWIGEGAFIRRGVTVGDGSVVAARALVLQDVPPFSVVAGVPARVIRLRFAEPVVESLLRTRWWELDLRDFEGLDFGDPARCAAIFEEGAAAARRFKPDRYMIEEIAKDRFLITLEP